MSTATVNVAMSGSRKRRIKDKLASVSVTAGGILVLVALLLITYVPAISMLLPNALY